MVDHLKSQKNNEVSDYVTKYGKVLGIWMLLKELY